MMPQEAIRGFPSVSEKELIAALDVYLGGLPDRVMQAIDFAKRAHPESIRRVSGNSVLEEHIYPVTLMHRDYNANHAKEDNSTADRLGTPIDNSVESVVADLLHDTLEDGIGITKDEILEKFGMGVFERVLLATNHSVLAANDEQRRAEINYLMMSRFASLDYRNPVNWDALVRKLCDGLNSLQTLPLPHNPAKQQRIIDKTLRYRLPLTQMHSRYINEQYRTELERLGCLALGDNQFVLSNVSRLIPTLSYAESELIMVSPRQYAA